MQDGKTCDIFSLICEQHIGNFVIEVMEKMQENEKGVKPAVEEVFAHCHIKKDKKWVDIRAEHAYISRSLTLPIYL